MTVSRRTSIRLIGQIAVVALATTIWISGLASASAPDPGATPGSTLWTAQAGGGTGSTTGGIPGPFVNLSARTYPDWRSAVARVRSGVGPATLWLGGDSTTAGVSAPYATVYPAALTALINSRIAPAAMTWTTALSPTGTLDPRVTTSGWSNPDNGYWLSSAPGATLSYAPSALAMGPQEVDTVDIYWIPLWDGGTFTVSTTNGAPLATVNTRTAGYAHRTTVALGSTMTSPTITITAGRAPVLIVALNAYNSTKPVIQVGNFGFSGSTAAGWQWPPGRNGNGFATLYATDPPDLMVLDLGINDAAAGEPVAAYRTYMQTLISRGRDVLLKTMVPSEYPPWSTYEPQYVGAVKDLASANNIGVVDTWDRWGGSYSDAASVGWYQDTLHPSALGNADVATAVYQALRLIS